LPGFKFFCIFLKEEAILFAPLIFENFVFKFLEKSSASFEESSAVKILSLRAIKSSLVLKYKLFASNTKINSDTGEKD